MPKILPGYTHLILTTTLGGQLYCYSYFTDKVAKAQRGQDHIPHKLQNQVTKYSICSFVFSILEIEHRDTQLFIYPRLKNGPPSIREGCPLWLSPKLQEGCTWSSEGVRGHLPSQPDEPNQPKQSMGWQISEPDRPHLLDVSLSICFANILSPTVGCLFTFLIVFFETPKV